MIRDMKRAIGVMAVLALVVSVAAMVDDELVLTGNGCPTGSDRWDTLGFDYASDGGVATKADAVRAWLRDASLDATNGSILRAIDRSERESQGDAPIVVETTEGLPAVLILDFFGGDGWHVIDSSWCRRRADV